jgi:dTMP kinase
MTGALIAFEGLDQSGKETQARRLQARCEAAGYEVDVLAFPCYQTAIAREIASALSGQRHYTPDVLQLLFIANRYEYRERIEAAVARGAVVLCDRYAASSIAYGEAFGLDAAWLADAQRFLPRPTATVLLDIAAGRAARRKRANRDHFERDLALLTRVRASYQRQAAADASWVVIDASHDIDTVAGAVSAAIDARLGLR